MNEPLSNDFAAKRQRIIEGSKKLDSGLAEVRQIQQEIRDRTKRAEDQKADFQKTYSTLAAKTAAVCNEIVLSRSHDEWSLAFSYLSNLILAQLAQAKQTDNERAFGAMLFDLSRLSTEMAKVFSGSALVIDAWQRSIAAMGSPIEPDPDPKPHPFADSLSQMVLLLRETGPKIGLREIYLCSENGLHVVRPA